jgi:outer membrane protein TolC
VRYAFVHSESLVSNKLDIQVASIDLKDAHSELMPTFQLITRYYFIRTDDADNPNPSKFNVQFAMTNWNPYEALIKIRAKSVFVDIAKLAHFDKISENVASIAKLFYGINNIQANIRGQKQILAIQNNKLNFGKSKFDQGNLDSFTLQSWTNTLKAQQIKIRSLERNLDQKTSMLKSLMGYHPDYHLPLDTRDAANQILNGFNGRWLTFADIQGRNLKLKMAAKKEQAQSVMVTGAYLQLVPKPLFVFTDNKNTPNTTSGVNMAVGLDYTLWDGFKRVRDISRQKFKAQQLEIDRQQLSEKLYGDFKRIRGEIDSAGEQSSLSREQAKLADLAEEKAAVLYKSGAIDYGEYSDQRVKTIEAHLNAANDLQNRVNELVDLATMAGGLNKYNAAIRY